TGNDPDGDPITETPSDDPTTPDQPNDPTVVEMTQEPELILTKRAISEGRYEVGEYIEYEIIVTNSGNVTLTNVTVEDDNAEITEGSPVATMAPGKSEVIHARHEVTQDDIDAG